MKFMEVLDKISGKPVGTEYKSAFGGSVKVTGVNEYTISIFGKEPTLVIHSENGFKNFTTDKWAKTFDVFSFGTAMDLLKKGKFVARATWPETMSIGCRDKTNIKFYTYKGDGKYTHGPIYNPTQEDMLATDWCVHEEKVD